MWIVYWKKPCIAIINWLLRDDAVTSSQNRMTVKESSGARRKQSDWKYFLTLTVELNLEEIDSISWKLTIK